MSEKPISPLRRRMIEDIVAVGPAEFFLDAGATNLN